MKIEDALKSRLIKDDFQKLYINIAFTSIWLEEQLNKLFKDIGITSHQYNVLRILRGSLGTPLPACDIQGRMIYKNSNVTRIIEKLVSKELTSKKSNEKNRRKIEVEITPAGLDLLAQLDMKVMQVHHNLFKNITVEEAQSFNNLLDKIRG